MTDARLDAARVDALVGRLDVLALPDDGFVRASLGELLPEVRAAREQDATVVGRLRRDLGATFARRRPVPRRQLALVTAILLLAVLAALAMVVGSQRRLPPPFGVAGNGEIAYVVDGHVFVADLNGAHARQLTFDTGLQLDPLFSRDGTRVSYRRFRLAGFNSDQDSADVVVSEADGSRAVVLVGAVRGLSHPAWSPDGRFIAFSGALAGAASSGVYVVPADGSGPLTTVSTASGVWDPVWSPDGRRLAFVDADGLVVANRDGTDAHVVTTINHEEIGQKGESAEWSPDGSMLTFTGGHPDGPTQVFVVRLDGSPEWQISRDANNAAHGVWSPDGTRIAFLQNGRGDGPIVFIADPLTGHGRSLPGYYGWFQPTWSPDGTKIIVTDDRPGPDNIPGPAVRVILDAVGSAPPIEIPAAGTNPESVPDTAASWQRLATR